MSGTGHPSQPTADLVATWPLGKSLVVGIAGGSASGKSLIAQELVSQVGGAAVAVLEHDGYYHHRPDLPFEERAAINYDHPDSFETDLMLEHLEALLAGRRVLKPRYDFAAHLRMDETVVEPRPVILIEGLMILAEPELRRRCDLKIYVDADADLRLLRRLRRDTRATGAAPSHRSSISTRPRSVRCISSSSSHRSGTPTSSFRRASSRVRCVPWEGCCGTTFANPRCLLSQRHERAANRRHSRRRRHGTGTGPRTAPGRLARRRDNACGAALKGPPMSKNGSVPAACSIRPRPSKGPTSWWSR